jgi:hypothetical protein
MSSDPTPASHPVKKRRPVHTRKKGPRVPTFAGPHRNGQYYTTKRINGVKVFFYFGRDERDARARYARELPEILAGRQPRAVIDPVSITVFEVTDRFVTAEEQRYRAGDIGIRQFDDLRRAAMHFRRWFGPDTAMERATDLAGFRAQLSRQMSVTSFNRNIVGVKRMLRWAYKRKPEPLLRVAMHEDDSLGKAKAKHARRERREHEQLHGKPLYMPEEVRAILVETRRLEDWDMLAMDLLAMNAGWAQSEIAPLPESVVDLTALHIDWVRSKTEEICQAPLWPVTAAAIVRSLAQRAAAARPEWAGLAFRTRLGYPWVQTYAKDDGKGPIGKVSPNDEIGKRFREIEERVRVGDKSIVQPGRRFKAFRRTFSTFGNDVLDKDAVKRIMGHGLGGMDPHYVRIIPIERRRAVTDYVHRKVLGCEPCELTLDNLIEKLSPPKQTADAPDPVTTTTMTTTQTQTQTPTTAVNPPAAPAA